jgi:hypothetical protein
MNAPSLAISLIKTLLVWSQRWEPLLRRSLRGRGAAESPGAVAGGFEGGRVLQEESEWVAAVTVLRRAGLPVHPDGPKNWDGLAALRLVLDRTGPEGRVLDAGGEIYSPFVEWLYLYGYRRLEVVNLAFPFSFRRGPIPTDGVTSRLQGTLREAWTRWSASA